MSKQLRSWLRDVVLFPLVERADGTKSVSLLDVSPGSHKRPLVGGGEPDAVLRALRSDVALTAAMQSGNLIGRCLWALGQQQDWPSWREGPRAAVASENWARASATLRRLGIRVTADDAGRVARQEKGAQEIAIRMVYQLRGVAAPLLRRPVGRGSLIRPGQTTATAPASHLAATGDRDEHPQLPNMSLRNATGTVLAQQRGPGKGASAPRKLLAATFSGAAPPAPSQYVRAVDRGVERTLQLKAPPEGERLEAVTFQRHAAEIESLRQERDALQRRRRDAHLAWLQQQRLGRLQSLRAHRMAAAARASHGAREWQRAQEVALAREATAARQQADRQRRRAARRAAARTVAEAQSAESIAAFEATAGRLGVVGVGWQEEEEHALAQETGGQLLGAPGEVELEALEAEAQLGGGPGASRLPTEADYVEAQLPHEELRRVMARRVLAAGLTLPRQQGPSGGRHRLQEGKEAPDDGESLLEDPGAARLRRRRAEQDRSLMRRARRRVAAVAQSVALRGGRSTAGRVVALAAALARQPAAAAEAVAAARRSAGKASRGMRHARLDRDAAQSEQAATTAELAAKAAAQAWREKELAEVKRCTQDAIRLANEAGRRLASDDLDAARRHAAAVVAKAVSVGLSVAAQRRADGRDGMESDVENDDQASGTGLAALARVLREAEHTPLQSGLCGSSRWLEAAALGLRRAGCPHWSGVDDTGADGPKNPGSGSCSSGMGASICARVLDVECGGQSIGSVPSGEQVPRPIGLGVAVSHADAARIGAAAFRAVLLAEPTAGIAQVVPASRFSGEVGVFLEKSIKAWGISAADVTLRLARGPSLEQMKTNIPSAEARACWQQLFCARLHRWATAIESLDRSWVEEGNLPLPLPLASEGDAGGARAQLTGEGRAAAAAFLPTAKRLHGLASIPLERAPAVGPEGEAFADVPKLPPAAIAMCAPPGCERLLWPVARRVGEAAARQAESKRGGPLVVVDPSRILWEGLRRAAGVWTEVRRLDGRHDSTLGGRLAWWDPAHAAVFECTAGEGEGKQEQREVGAGSGEGQECSDPNWQDWLASGAVKLPRVPSAGVLTSDPPSSCLPFGNSLAVDTCTRLGEELARWAAMVHSPQRLAPAALLIAPWAVAAARPPAKLLAAAVALAVRSWGEVDGWAGGPVPGEVPGKGLERGDPLSETDRTTPGTTSPVAAENASTRSCGWMLLGFPQDKEHVAALQATLWPHAIDHAAWRAPEACGSLALAAGLGGDVLAAVAREAHAEASIRGFPNWARNVLLSPATGSEFAGDSMVASRGLVADRLSGGGLLLETGESGDDSMNLDGPANSVRRALAQALQAELVAAGMGEGGAAGRSVRLALAPLCQGTAVGENQGHPASFLSSPAATLILDMPEKLAIQAALGWIDGGEWLPGSDGASGLHVGTLSAQSRALTTVDAPSTCRNCFQVELDGEVSHAVRSADIGETYLAPPAAVLEEWERLGGVRSDGASDNRVGTLAAGQLRGNSVGKHQNASFWQLDARVEAGPATLHSFLAPPSGAHLAPRSDRVDAYDSHGSFAAAHLLLRSTLGERLASWRSFRAAAGGAQRGAGIESSLGVPASAAGDHADHVGLAQIPWCLSGSASLAQTLLSSDRAADVAVQALEDSANAALAAASVVSHAAGKAHKMDIAAAERQIQRAELLLRRLEGHGDSVRIGTASEENNAASGAGADTTMEQCSGSGIDLEMRTNSTQQQVVQVVARHRAASLLAAAARSRRRRSEQLLLQLQALTEPSVGPPGGNEIAGSGVASIDGGVADADKLSHVPSTAAARLEEAKQLVAHSTDVELDEARSLRLALASLAREAIGQGGQSDAVEGSSVAASEDGEGGGEERAEARDLPAWEESTSLLAPPTAAAAFESEAGGKKRIEAKGKGKKSDTKGKKGGKKSTEAGTSSGWAGADEEAAAADEEEAEFDDSSVEAALEAARAGDAVTLALAVGKSRGEVPFWSTLQPAPPLGYRQSKDSMADKPTSVSAAVSGEPNSEDEPKAGSLPVPSPALGLVPRLPSFLAKAASDAEAGGQTRLMQQLRGASKAHVASSAVLARFIAATEGAYATGVGMALESASLAASAAPFTPSVGALAGGSPPQSLRESIEAEAEARIARATAIERKAISVEGAIDVQARRALRYRVHVRLPAEQPIEAVRHAGGGTDEPDIARHVQLQAGSSDHVPGSDRAVVSLPIPMDPLDPLAWLEQGRRRAAAALDTSRGGEGAHSRRSSSRVATSELLAGAQAAQDVADWHTKLRRWAVRSAAAAADAAPRAAAASAKAWGDVAAWEAWRASAARESCLAVGAAATGREIRLELPQARSLEAEPVDGAPEGAESPHGVAVGPAFSGNGLPILPSLVFDGATGGLPVPGALGDGAGPGCPFIAPAEIGACSSSDVKGGKKGLGKGKAGTKKEKEKGKKGGSGAGADAAVNFDSAVDGLVAALPEPMKTAISPRVQKEILMGLATAGRGRIPLYGVDIPSLKAASDSGLRSAHDHRLPAGEEEYAAVEQLMGGPLVIALPAIAQTANTLVDSVASGVTPGAASGTVEQPAGDTASPRSGGGEPRGSNEVEHSWFSYGWDQVMARAAEGESGTLGKKSTNKGKSKGKGAGKGSKGKGSVGGSSGDQTACGDWKLWAAAVEAAQKQARLRVEWSTGAPGSDSESENAKQKTKGKDAKGKGKGKGKAAAVDESESDDEEEREWRQQVLSGLPLPVLLRQRAHSADEDGEDKSLELHLLPSWGEAPPMAPWIGGGCPPGPSPLSLVSPSSLAKGDTGDAHGGSKGKKGSKDKGKKDGDATTDPWSDWDAQHRTQESARRREQRRQAAERAGQREWRRATVQSCAAAVRGAAWRALASCCAIIADADAWARRQLAARDALMRAESRRLRSMRQLARQEAVQTEQAAISLAAEEEVIDAEVRTAVEGALQAALDAAEAEAAAAGAAVASGGKGKSGSGKKAGAKGKGKSKGKKGDAHGKKGGVKGQGAQRDLGYLATKWAQEQLQRDEHFAQVSRECVILGSGGKPLTLLPPSAILAVRTEAVRSAQRIMAIAASGAKAVLAAAIEAAGIAAQAESSAARLAAKHAATIRVIAKRVQLATITTEPAIALALPLRSTVPAAVFRMAPELQLPTGDSLSGPSFPTNGASILQSTCGPGMDLGAADASKSVGTVPPCGVLSTDDYHGSDKSRPSAGGAASLVQIVRDSSEAVRARITRTKPIFRASAARGSLWVVPNSHAEQRDVSEAENAPKDVVLHAFGLGATGDSEPAGAASSVPPPCTLDEAEAQAAWFIRSGAEQDGVEVEADSKAESASQTGDGLHFAGHWVEMGLSAAETLASCSDMPDISTSGSDDFEQGLPMEDAQAALTQAATGACMLKGGQVLGTGRSAWLLALGAAPSRQILVSTFSSGANEPGTVTDWPALGAWAAGAAAGLGRGGGRGRWGLAAEKLTLAVSEGQRSGMPPREACMNAAIQGWLTKPMSPRELQASSRAALHLKQSVPRNDGNAARRLSLALSGWLMEATRGDVGGASDASGLSGLEYDWTGPATCVHASAAAADSEATEKGATGATEFGEGASRETARGRTGQALATLACDQGLGCSDMLDDLTWALSATELRLALRPGAVSPTTVDEVESALADVDAQDPGLFLRLRERLAGQGEVTSDDQEFSADQGSGGVNAVVASSAANAELAEHFNEDFGTSQNPKHQELERQWHNLPAPLESVGHLLAVLFWARRASILRQEVVQMASDESWRREVAEGGAIVRRAAALHSSLSCFMGDAGQVADCWDDFGEAALAVDGGHRRDVARQSTGSSPVLGEWLRLGGSTSGAGSGGMASLDGTSNASPAVESKFAMVNPAWVLLPVESEGNSKGKSTGKTKTKKGSAKGKAKRKVKGKGKGKSGVDVNLAVDMEAAAACLAAGDPCAVKPTVRALREFCPLGTAVSAAVALARAEISTPVVLAMQAAATPAGVDPAAWVVPHLVSEPPEAVSRLAGVAAALAGRSNPGSVAAERERKAREAVLAATSGELGELEWGADRDEEEAERSEAHEPLPAGLARDVAAAWRMVDAVRGGGGGGVGDAGLLVGDQEAAKTEAEGAGGSKRGGKKKNR